MKPPEDWEQVIDGIRYSTKTAILIARGHDRIIDDHQEKDWNIFLYRTLEGGYFKVHLSSSYETQSILEPMNRVEALHQFDKLSERFVEIEDAFPDPENGDNEIMLLK
jgi:hypothetical protein